MGESTTVTLLRLSAGGVRTLTLEDRRALARAHNAHDALLAACRMIDGELSDPRMLGLAIPRMRKALAAAIAKAEGREVAHG